MQETKEYQNTIDSTKEDISFTHIQQEPQAPTLWTRRQYLQASALGLLGMSALPQLAEAGRSYIPRQTLPGLQDIADAGKMVAGQGLKRRGYVAEVKHLQVFPLGGYSPNIRAVNAMLENLMMMLTRQSSSTKAWQKMVGPGDKVSILVDAQGNAVSRTRKAVIDCVVLGLRRAGVHPNDIIIWTTFGRLLPHLGYNLNWNRPGVKVLGAHQLGYDRKYRLAQIGGNSMYLSKIVSKYSSHIINIATLEDHPIIGCRLCLAQQASASLSRGQILERYWGGAQGIAGIAAHPLIRQKFILHLIDGLSGTYNGHLRPWQPQVLLGGTDPVAVDRQGFALIDSQRRRAGVPVITGTRRTPVHINHAALKGVGLANLMQIQHHKRVLK